MNFSTVYLGIAATDPGRTVAVKASPSSARFSRLAAAALVLCLSTSAVAQIFSYTGPAVAIPDNVPAGVNVPLTVAGQGTIADLNFRFDTAGPCDATVGDVDAAVSHTFVGDLIFKLTSPLGTTVTLVNRRGGTRENICLSILNDEGGLPSLSTITSTSGIPVSGNFTPDNALSAFDGQNPNGVWTLNVSDNASADIGTVRRFSLLFNADSPPVLGSKRSRKTHAGAGLFDVPL